MNQRKVHVACVAGMLALPVAASGYEFRSRWVERIGTTDTVITDNYLMAEDGFSHRVRLQFGVFDDANGPAPIGGFIGWQDGTMTVSGPANNSDDRRTPGRLPPFTFGAMETAWPNGMDPFTSLTGINATLGLQTHTWGCDSDGVPLPQPSPTVRGLNTFVSVYEITVGARDGVTNYEISVTGGLRAAVEWRTVGSHTHPDCDTGTPGQVTYAPFPAEIRPFTGSLTVHLIPTPAGAVLGVAGVLFATGRRRPPPR